MGEKNIELNYTNAGVRNILLLEIDEYKLSYDTENSDTYCRYIIANDTLNGLDINKYYLPIFYYDNSYNIYYTNNLKIGIDYLKNVSHKIGNIGLFNDSVSVLSSDFLVSEMYTDTDGFDRVDITIPDVYNDAEILDIYTGVFNSSLKNIHGTYTVPYKYGMIAMCCNFNNELKIESFNLGRVPDDSLYYLSKYSKLEGYSIIPLILVHNGKIIYNAFLNINKRYENDLKVIQDLRKKINSYAISGDIEAEYITETISAEEGTKKNTMFFAKSSYVKANGYLTKVSVRIDVVEPTLQIYRLRGNEMQQVGEINTSNAKPGKINTYVLNSPIEIQAGDYYMVNATAGYIQNGNSLIIRDGVVESNKAEFQQSFTYSYTYSYQKKTFYVLDSKGYGDFTTIEDVINNVPINSTVFVKNGEYSQINRNGLRNVFKKGINWIGESKSGVIFSHYTGDYSKTALVYSGTFKNITFLSGDNGSVTETPSNLAYSIHIDFMEREENVKFGCEFYNCNFVSYWHTCVGIGQRKDYVIEFHNCDFQYMGGVEKEDYSEIYKRCCIAAHNVANTEDPDLVGKGYTKLYYCRLHSNGSCCMMIHNHISIDYPNTWELIGNVMYSDMRGKDCVYSSNKKNYINEFDNYGTELSNMSYGNNISFLNADQLVE